MTEVIKYVKIHNGKVDLREVFLMGGKADDLSSDILQNIKSDGLDLMVFIDQVKSLRHRRLVTVGYNNFNVECRPITVSWVK